ncbi:hypothetical protein C2G38_2031185 [Gigaspora rosea]|uniref:Uncharacterized protein n=1 Tax=Gigaspora rosea TaxID=44941 RepID=A0A397VV92_9GLOM|nr:hypothetical protein C2G38_2031185 [Gigaspora rosea]
MEQGDKKTEWERQKTGMEQQKKKRDGKKRTGRQEKGQEDKKTEQEWWTKERKLQKNKMRTSEKLAKKAENESRKRRIRPTDKKLADTLIRQVNKNLINDSTKKKNLLEESTKKR